MTTEPSADVPPERPEPATHMRITPRFAIVRSYHDGGPIAVYGVYNTKPFAEKVMDSIKELGIGFTDRMEVVPYYEVTP